MQKEETYYLIKCSVFEQLVKVINDGKEFNLTYELNPIDLSEEGINKLAEKEVTSKTKAYGFMADTINPYALDGYKLALLNLKKTITNG